MDVSFVPVSTVGEILSSDDGAKVPRFVASDDPDMVLRDRRLHHDAAVPVRDQPDGLRYRTGHHEYLGGSGSCTIEYSGADAPDDLMSQPISRGARSGSLVSAIAPEFQGYITATCGFRDAYGFAFITNGYPGGPPTLAQGYLAVLHGLRRPIAQRLLA